eukprot:403376553
MESLLNYQPVKPLINAYFWMEFTQKKLNDWKLQNPKASITGQVSLPQTLKHPQSVELDSYSLSGLKRKTIGGLLHFKIPGAFHHTNTIEEFDACQDLRELIDSESQEILDPENFSCVNKMIVYTFGDLKNYLFHYSKSNKLNQFLSNEQISGIKNSIFAYIKQNEELSMAFVITEQDDEFFNISLDIGKALEPQNFLVFFDSSPLLPTKLLKNYIAKINHRFQKEENGEISKVLKIILVRDKISQLSEQVTIDNSFYLEVKLTKQENYEGLQLVPIDFSQLKPVKISLKEQMDPKIISEESCDLNLKLMKWRMAPGLNLDVLKSTKVLLLGSGSLGCQVGRCLLSWGFRNVTFVDYGKVAYSNPVRQCLFTFEDSHKADNQKAIIAAQRLQEIFPSVQTEGKVLRIPMPGHATGNTQEALDEFNKDIDELEELIKSHDAIFLLTDSRESRWLPTVMAAAHDKICMTIALGFETFLVMRHGLSQETHNPVIHGERLGCYFCNDIVAPRNSVADRTLDQQCTVSRPALCCISSALGVELLTSMLNHPLKNGAIARENAHECDRSELGIIPQQIRGDLSSFGMNIMHGQAFDKCIGCSSKVLQAFKEDGKAFVLKACNDPDYLEELTGITAMFSNMKVEDIECFDFDEEME